MYFKILYRIISYQGFLTEIIEYNTSYLDVTQYYLEEIV